MRMTPTTHRRPLILQTLATVLVTMMFCSFVLRARAFSRCRPPVPATAPHRPKRTVHHSSMLRMKPNSYEQMEDPNSFSLSGYQRPKVNWYPGHIAKAERQLAETLKSVDVVIEVRDSRAPKATAHPSVGKWAAGRPRVVVLTRVDTVTTRSRETWRQAYERLGADRWQEKLAGDERNRNAQFETERRKYVDGEDGDSVKLRGADGVEEVRRCDFMHTTDMRGRKLLTIVKYFDRFCLLTRREARARMPLRERYTERDATSMKGGNEEVSMTGLCGWESSGFRTLASRR